MSSAVLRVLSQRLPYPANLKRILLQQHWSCDKCALKNLATSAYVFQVQKPATEDSGKEIDIQRERPYAHLSFGEKVVRAGTDLTYLLIIAVGIGVTGILFYAVGSELFGSTGSNAVYSKAFTKCLNSTKVLDALGQPVKAHGETNRRGRRQHVISNTFMTNSGEEHTRIQFYLAGAFRTATVNAEMFKNADGKLEFEYLVVELDGYPPKTIELERRLYQPSQQYSF
ncbi:TIMM21 [Bugula neritina]|uniref:Mitochondrial import inner membrane translocase subunit Tim21 n=1 Tax=Bugula neritina TaxID=10212 RepID=A0A7J7IVB6_BUGNE|nr:TIMM21 [Bugula neritina]